METQLPQGLVRISDYKDLLQSKLFLRVQKFSNNFIDQNSEILFPYGRKWAIDSLHQWSRQWEYPFVFSQIEKYAAAHYGRPIKIFDAGSGITFFPYFLEENIHEAILTCCDTGTKLQEMFKIVNTQRGNKVEFLHSDIRDTGLESNSFDIIYCVSVLEHTSNYDEIIKEFVRLLKDDGILVVTFDISLDGHSSIPITEAKKLMASLQSHLSATDPNSIAKLFDERELFGPEVITTVFMSDWDKSLLPWKYPLLSSVLASLKKRKFPRFRIKRLTFTCHTFNLS